MMISRIQLSLLLLIAAAAWGGILVLSGFVLSPGLFRPFSIVLGVLVLVVAAFDLLLWRLPVLKGWLVRRPNVRGTWQGILESDWVDPETGNTVEPVLAYVAIRQTYSWLSIRLMTPESSSRLIAAEISRDEDGEYRLSGVYLNVPQMNVRYRSPIHFGAMVLQVHGRPPFMLDGHYWTDRDTRGTMRLERRSSSVYSHFEKAEEALGASDTG